MLKHNKRCYKNFKVANGQNQVIGYAGVNLEARIDKETHWGNFCADLCRSEFNTDLALINICKTIPAGPITLSQLEESFTSQVITVVNISGAALKLALENVVQISGFSYTFDGEGIQTISFIDGGPLDPNEIYTLATTNKG